MLLRFLPSLRPKFPFYINIYQSILFPVLPQDSFLEEVYCSSLHLTCCLRIYLNREATFRREENLIISFSGPNKLPSLAGSGSHILYLFVSKTLLGLEKTHLLWCFLNYSQHVHCLLQTLLKIFGGYFHLEVSSKISAGGPPLGDSTFHIPIIVLLYEETYY